MCSVLVEDVSNLVQDTVQWMTRLLTNSNDDQSKPYDGSVDVIVYSPKVTNYLYLCFLTFQLCMSMYVCILLQISTHVNDLRRELSLAVMRQVDQLKSNINDKETEIATLSKRLHDATQALAASAVSSTSTSTSVGGNAWNGALATPVKGSSSDSVSTSVVQSQLAVMKGGSGMTMTPTTADSALVRRASSPGTNPKEFSKMLAELNAEVLFVLPFCICHLV